MELGINVPHGLFSKIKDEVNTLFGGTSARLIIWREGDKFFAHKSMVMKRHGQNTQPEFIPDAIQEVFPTEVISTVYLSASEMSLKEFYHTLDAPVVDDIRFRV